MQVDVAEEFAGQFDAASVVAGIERLMAGGCSAAEAATIWADGNGLLAVSMSVRGGRLAAIRFDSGGRVALAVYL